MVATAIPSALGQGLNLHVEDASTSPHPSNVSLNSLPLLSTYPLVRSISADQLHQAHQQFISTPLPSKSMFPWLHGVDGTSSTQNYFFGLNNSPSNPAPLPLPEHRGLIFVHANEKEPGRLLGSVSPTEILQPAPRSSSSPVSSPNTKTTPMFGASSSHDNNHHPQVHHQYAALTAQQQQQQQQQQKDKDGAHNSSDWDISDSTSSVSSSSLTSTSSLTGLVTPSSTIHGLTANLGSSFVQSLSEGINIRNFKIQVPRYALLSDIVVYGSEGTTDAGLILLLHVAKQISSAQEEVWRNLIQHYPHYDIDSRRQTFVLGGKTVSLLHPAPHILTTQHTHTTQTQKRCNAHCWMGPP